MSNKTPFHPFLHPPAKGSCWDTASTGLLSSLAAKHIPEELWRRAGGPQLRRVVLISSSHWHQRENPAQPKALCNPNSCAQILLPRHFETRESLPRNCAFQTAAWAQRATKSMMANPRQQLNKWSRLWLRNSSFIQKILPETQTLSQSWQLSALASCSCSWAHTFLASLSCFKHRDNRTGSDYHSQP